MHTVLHSAYVHEPAAVSALTHPRVFPPISGKVPVRSDPDTCAYPPQSAPEPSLHTLSRGLHLTAHGRTYGDGAALLHSPLPAAAAAGSPGHHLRFGHTCTIALLSPELLISIVANIGSPSLSIICCWRAHDVISYIPQL